MHVHVITLQERKSFCLFFKLVLLSFAVGAIVFLSNFKSILMKK